ncbi:hypothetical protein [Microcystis aeruginosa]|uniref:NACHT-NTPase and P-loop NTPases N-terminal domain-containing protein n=1 Tax=Microcystis aeruginosa PCC 7806SL TaxID=1903187 RepID=A0AB33BVU9_MICA7|nr:hypothetical protein [Microcystis aeruginosa]TRT97544.1 MAG: hypothetical protein EWV61_18770 [Microcystis aeruginosa Ma_AC_P_19900807_S300]ARI81974.1 hypothetical protein BH695_2695 [Microcystis aeruginosa PCC 7806SL]ELS44794.1 hypothetical protein C789_5411 [Microcystis aeruginosa FACHB-905 = DIANCHI905]UGS11050.1 hypothetical protein LRR78_10895 [Microcystis aeruginosa FACHB-905 = DIANCHI905]WKX62187.1 hypothetical protein Q3H53_002176 [Microcystis aeruginosa PCC 7806]
MEPITVATIVALVFQTTVEKFTEAALEKINTLRQIIWNKLKANPNAEKALQSAEKGSKTDLEKVADYLKVAMNDESDFAEQVKGLATEIQSLKIQDNSSMNQTNSGGQNLQNQGEIGEVYQAETININKT